jgi:plasmid stability protein
MKNLTIRNIPDELLEKIKVLSKAERRSLNSEILIILEKGLDKKLSNSTASKSNISRNLQVEIWRTLASKWEDDRSTEKIIKDIYDHRTMGRNVEL